MLQFLRIKNLALIDDVSLEFNTGFTTFTGETGAGKSVLLGALALLAGSRSDKTIIKQNKDACEVQASLFIKQNSALNSFLENAGLPTCDDNQLLLYRSLSLSKGSRIQINGSLSTLSTLQELSAFWIDIHGPTEPQKLFSEKNQLAFLDSFAQIDSDKKQFANLFSSWQNILSSINELENHEKLSDDALDFLKNQLAKFDQLDLSPNTIESLEQDFKNISCSQEILSLSSQITHTLSGDNSISLQLANLRKYAQRLSEIDPSKQPLLNHLDTLIIETEDLSSDFAKLAQSCDYDEQQVSDIQNKMSILCDLKRQYGSNTSSLALKKEELSKKLDLQSGIDDKLSQLQSKAKDIEKTLLHKASLLHSDREKTSKILEKEVAKCLLSLGFKQTAFYIKLSVNQQLTQSGNTLTQFLFSPNAGSPPLPLNKIASSGELARVMLAIKTVLAQVDNTPLLVFDEVDANVGGEIGSVVGHELAKLAENHQVFCVTHLPQVAAQAQNHFLVAKEQSDNTTTVSISPLHSEHPQRLSELARMLGDRNSPSALKHAEQLLSLS